MRSSTCSQEHALGNVVLHEWRVHLCSLCHTFCLLLPLLCNSNGIHEEETIGPLCVISLFLIRDQVHIHNFIVVCKIFLPPMCTLSMELSRTSSTILGNFREKRKKFLTNAIVDLYTFASICTPEIDSEGYDAIIVAFDLFIFSFSWCYGNIRLKHYLFRPYKIHVVESLPEQLGLKNIDDISSDAEGRVKFKLDG